MQFSQVTLTVNSVAQLFDAYDRGANGAFVFRKSGVLLHAPRLVVSTETNDASSDKSAVQTHVPRTAAAVAGVNGGLPVLLGTDLVKTDLRFLANTSEADRTAQLDLHIAALQQFRDTFEKREKIYS